MLVPWMSMDKSESQRKTIYIGLFHGVSIGFLNGLFYGVSIGFPIQQPSNQSWDQSTGVEKRKATEAKGPRLCQELSQHLLRWPMGFSLRAAWCFGSGSKDHGIFWTFRVSRHGTPIKRSWWLISWKIPWKIHQTWLMWGCPQFRTPPLEAVPYKVQVPWAASFGCSLAKWESTGQHA